MVGCLWRFSLIQVMVVLVFLLEETEPSFLKAFLPPPFIQKVSPVLKFWLGVPSIYHCGRSFLLRIVGKGYKAPSPVSRYSPWSSCEPLVSNEPRCDLWLSSLGGDFKTAFKLLTFVVWGHLLYQVMAVSAWHRYLLYSSLKLFILPVQHMHILMLKGVSLLL